MTAQQNTLAQTSGNSLDCSFGTKLRRFGAGLAAAAQLGGGVALPAVGTGASLVAPAAVVAGAAFLGTMQQGESAVLMNASDIEAAQTLGASQADTVWYQGTVNGNTVTASGTLVRGQDADWIITVAHAAVFAQGTISLSNMTVGNGTSFKNDPGLTVGVSAIYVSPSYVPGGNSGLDYMFLKLDNRLSTPDLIFNLGNTPSFGAPVLFTGYGIPAVMSGESVIDNGNVMSFYASYTSDAAWNAANDSGLFTGQHDSGYGSTRDSGGSVKTFNSLTGQWENVGMVLGGTAGSTIFLNYNNADSYFNNHLYDVVQPVPAVPEPSLFFLFGVGVAGSCFYRKKESEN